MYTYLEYFCYRKKFCAVGPIFNVGYREHTAPLFMESKIMTIYQLNYYMVCIFMYKYRHLQLLAIFDNMFITNDNILYLLY